MVGSRLKITVKDLPSGQLMADMVGQLWQLRSGSPPTGTAGCEWLLNVAWPPGAGDQSAQSFCWTFHCLYKEIASLIPHMSIICEIRCLLKTINISYFFHFRFDAVTPWGTPALWGFIRFHCHCKQDSPFGRMGHPWPGSVTWLSL